MQTKDKDRSLDGGSVNTGLFIAVPEAESAVGAWRLQYDPPASIFMPAHVTLLYPFLLPAAIDQPVVEKLELIFARRARFAVEFKKTSRFGDEVLYLAPDPASPFVEMTQVLSAEFSLEPYGGAFAEVIPHLTVAQVADPKILDAAAKDVAGHLPISSIAKEVWLMEKRDRWYVRQRFGLGDLLSRPRRKIRIVDSNPRWPEIFEAERELILSVVGDTVSSIEHVGSTAVPGLGAKPIVDILGGLDDLYDAFRCIEPLASIGYNYIPEYESVLPERRYFHKRPQDGRWFNLHLAEVGGDFWDRHIGFRDYLRREPEAASEYHRLKVSLARQFPEDTAAYTDAKTDFIRAAEAKALGNP